jgi:uncharacterized glyoxalase superfamily protein PhnB
MKDTPQGWPRISVGVWYQDAAKAIDWLCDAFGFEVRLRVEGEGGSIMHSELVYGGGVVMVGSESPPHRDAPWRKSPQSIGGANTQSMMLYVDDVDAHCERARRVGATIASELADVDHGEGYWKDRGYEAIDLEGHHWWFFQRLRDPK